MELWQANEILSPCQHRGVVIQLACRAFGLLLLSSNNGVGLFTTVACRSLLRYYHQLCTVDGIKQHNGLESQFQDVSSGLAALQVTFHKHMSVSGGVYLLTSPRSVWIECLLETGGLNREACYRFLFSEQGSMLLRDDVSYLKCRSQREGCYYDILH